MLVACDIAIVGSGFGGSLLALAAKRSGRSVVLLERGCHPRFAIGESSTPLANLLLEEMAQQFELPEVAPLSKWGSWQRRHPRIACGLKRGFTFYYHRTGERFQPRCDRANELLVGASPHDEVADTHWYRPDFDCFLVEQALSAGVEYFDHVTLRTLLFERGGVQLEAQRGGKNFSVRAKFVVDASGPRGFLHKALNLPEQNPADLPRTCGLYSHFTGVRRFEDLIARPAPDVPPYPPDDAALHHVFDGGWIWVLRFNNGVTSAGAALTESWAARLKITDGDAAWERLLTELPSVREQFAEAEATRPFQVSPRLSFLSSIVRGPGWALLPSAAGFIDPLLSTGFPLTLLGVKRLAEAIEESWGAERFAGRLEAYEAQTRAELRTAERLVAALYANMNNFETFAGLSLLYFAAASFSETARRLGKPALASSFLLHDRAGFGEGLRDCCELGLRAAREGLTPEVRSRLTQKIRETINPIDVAGLADFTRRNWYPAKAEDLLNGAARLGVDEAAVRSLLRRCGFLQPGVLPG